MQKPTYYFDEKGIDYKDDTAYSNNAMVAVLQSHGGECIFWGELIEGLKKYYPKLMQTAEKDVLEARLSAKLRNISLSKSWPVKRYQVDMSKHPDSKYHGRYVYAWASLPGATRK